LKFKTYLQYLSTPYELSLVRTNISRIGTEHEVKPWFKNTLVSCSETYLEPNVVP